MTKRNKRNKGKRKSDKLKEGNKEVMSCISSLPFRFPSCQNLLGEIEENENNEIFNSNKHSNEK